MVAKTMTEIWKPGANNKVAAIPYVQLKTSKG